MHDRPCNSTSASPQPAAAPASKLPSAHSTATMQRPQRPSAPCAGALQRPQAAPAPKLKSAHGHTSDSGALQLRQRPSSKVHTTTQRRQRPSSTATPKHTQPHIWQRRPAAAPAPGLQRAQCHTSGCALQRHQRPSCKASAATHLAAAPCGISAQAPKRTQILNHRYTYILANMCIHAWMYTCVQAFRHTCVHEYMHTCVKLRDGAFRYTTSHFTTLHTYPYFTYITYITVQRMT